MESKKEVISKLLHENYGIETESINNFESTTLKNLNLDSLDFAQLIFEIEAKFDFKFSKTEESNLPDMTFGQLLAFLDSACTS
jgi:acyl carrier protein